MTLQAPLPFSQTEKMKKDEICLETLILAEQLERIVQPLPYSAGEWLLLVRRANKEKVP